MSFSPEESLNTAITPRIEILPLEYAGLSPQEALGRLARAFSRRVLLESSSGHGDQGRYSFLGAAPFLTIQARQEIVTLIWEDRVETLTEDPFMVIRRLLNRFQRPKPALDIPFSGGAMGIFAYDMVRRIERLPEIAENVDPRPDIYLMFFDNVLAWDHLLKRAWFFHTPFDDLPGRHQVSRDLLRSLHEDRPILGNRNGVRIGDPSSNLGRDGYIDRVARCKSYIAAGDIFQANLSHRFSMELEGVAPENLYQTLRTINPSSYGGACITPEFAVLSTSPERLICVRNGIVQTRPIAGTRPWGFYPEENRRWKRELLSSAKERAEHVMLVDLERNDLGRICRYGSIEVDQWMTTESYSHVVHIVSNIRGVLNTNLDALDVVKAVFPGGTITGVPKVRCMEIIEELEPMRRWAYTGSLGYISFTGDMDMNILIRTLVLKEGVGHFQVGAGIVADSIPDAEYEETLHKARSFFEAMRRVREAYPTEL